MELGTLVERVRAKIRTFPDFPRKGVLFRDLMPVFRDPVLVSEILLYFERVVEAWGIEAVAGIESRGFLLGVPLAVHFRVPFIPVRKLGKLPGETLSRTYSLEYGEATVEIQRDAVRSGMRVLVHDDLLATGGTAEASGRLIEEAGGRLAGFLFIVGLRDLGGADRLRRAFPDVPIFALVEF